VGYHSGECGGILPETFRIVREILNRIDDPKTGVVNQALHMPPSEFKLNEAKFMAQNYGTALYDKYTY